MKAIYVLALGLLLSQKSEATVCRAQVLKTPCGTGKIELTFFERFRSFNLKNGDAICWNEDTEYSGDLEKLGTHAPYFLDATYEMYVEDAGQVKKLGTYIFDPALKVLMLSIGSKTYNLTCD